MSERRVSISKALSMLRMIAPRWRTPARMNAISNYCNFVTLALLNLTLTPVLITLLGTSSFGVWKACLRFLDLTTVADGRGTQALKWVTAFRAGTDDPNAQRRLVGAAVAVWLLWAPLLILVLVGIVFAIPQMIEGLTGDQIVAARWTAAILALNVLLAGLLGIPDAVLIGANRGWRSMNVNTVFLVASNAGFVVAAHLGYGIVSFAVITLCAATANALLTWIAARRAVPWWGIRRPDRADVKALAGFSGWTLAWMFAQALFLSGELILFSWLLGADAVTGYSVTSYATQSGLAICLMTVSAKIPGIARAIGLGHEKEAAEGVLRCRQLAIGAAGIIGGATLLLNKSFVRVWAGPHLYLGDTVNALMVIAFVQMAWLRCDAQLQDATLSIRTRGIAGLLVAMGSLAGGWVAFRLFGHIAAAYIALIAIRLPLHFIFIRSLKIKVPDSALPWRLIVITPFVFVAETIIGPNIDVSSWRALFITGICTTLCLVILTIFGVARIGRYSIAKVTR